MFLYKFCMLFRLQTEMQIYLALRKKEKVLWLRVLIVHNMFCFPDIFFLIGKHTISTIICLWCFLIWEALIKFITGMLIFPFSEYPMMQNWKENDPCISEAWFLKFFWQTEENILTGGLGGGVRTPSILGTYQGCQKAGINKRRTFY